MKKIAVFLDRDGTINEDVGYPSHFEQIKIFPYSFEAIRKINKAGLLAIVVTNQSGITRGFFTEKDLLEIHKRMADIFARHGAHFDAIYYCPHYCPSSNMSNSPLVCKCRKPLPGMAERAAKEFNIDLKKSYMVGDKVDDILFGLNIGAKAILVLTGFGKSTHFHLKELKIKPSYIANNLLDAVNWILNDINRTKK
jgi:D-glycero-D-manno-heptose 1,7-bisphosphate phosphatase